MAFLTDRICIFLVLLKALCNRYVFSKHLVSIVTRQNTKMIFAHLLYVTYLFLMVICSATGVPVSGTCVQVPTVCSPMPYPRLEASRPNQHSCTSSWSLLCLLHAQELTAPPVPARGGHAASFVSLLTPYGLLHLQRGCSNHLSRLFASATLYHRADTWQPLDNEGASSVSLNDPWRIQLGEIVHSASYHSINNLICSV